MQRAYFPISSPGVISQEMFSQYWPDKGSKKYGLYEVELLSAQKENDYVMRRLQVTNHKLSVSLLRPKLPVLLRSSNPASFSTITPSLFLTPPPLSLSLRVLALSPSLYPSISPSLPLSLFDKLVPMCPLFLCTLLVCSSLLTCLPNLTSKS